MYELIARTKNLIDLGYRLGAECHRSNCLNAATLIDFGDTCHLCSKKDGRIDLTFGIGRRTENNLLTAGNSCRDGQHQYGAEQGCRATRNIKTDTINRYRLLPAGHSRLRFHLIGQATLRFVEERDVVSSLTNGECEFFGDGFCGFVKFGRIDP